MTPLPRPLGPALHGGENWPGRYNYFRSARLSSSQASDICDHSSLHWGGGPRTTCFPACVLVPQIRALQSGCPPCRIARGPPLWRPPTRPTVLVPSRSVGLSPIGRAPPPRSTTPNVGGCRLTIYPRSSLPLALSGTTPLDGVLNGSASLRPPLALRPFPPPLQSPHPPALPHLLPPRSSKGFQPAPARPPLGSSPPPHPRPGGWCWWSSRSMPWSLRRCVRRTPN